MDPSNLRTGSTTALNGPSFGPRVFQQISKQPRQYRRSASMAETTKPSIAAGASSQGRPVSASFSPFCFMSDLARRSNDLTGLTFGLDRSATR